MAEDLAARAGAGPLVKKFAGLLAERRRIDHLPAMVTAYRDLVDAELGRVRAQVRTSISLTDGEKSQLANRLQAAVGKQVILEETTDPNLLGGFVAQVGSLILDGSLDGQLARLRERLVRG
ncbi:MAG: ATP synthase F1 subunit delta [Candidatus Rokuibacteriota bacterium]|nr:MAG: ATP synthase F1 subunit delta [Candidatus Rokubacteria bacterium]